MLAFLTAGIVAAVGIAASPGGKALTRVTGERLYVTDANGRREFGYEKGLAPADARGLLALVKARCRGSALDVVRVPGRAGAFLIVAEGCKTAAAPDMGLRLILLERTGAEIKVLDRTQGNGDAYSIRPVVFAGEGRTIVLAELAAEYSWGLVVYEVAGDALRRLGRIDAGAPAKEEWDFGERDPTPYARVSLEDGKLVVTFDSDLVIGTTGDSSGKIALKPVVFREGAKGFALDRPRFKPAVPAAR